MQSLFRNVRFDSITSPIQNTIKNHPDEKLFLRYRFNHNYYSDSLEFKIPNVLEINNITLTVIDSMNFSAPSEPPKYSYRISCILEITGVELDLAMALDSKLLIRYYFFHPIYGWESAKTEFVSSIEISDSKLNIQFEGLSWKNQIIFESIFFSYRLNSDSESIKNYINYTLTNELDGPFYPY